MTYELTIFDGHIEAGVTTIEAENIEEAESKAETWAQDGDWDHEGTVDVRIECGGEEVSRIEVAVGE